MLHQREKLFFLMQSALLLITLTLVSGVAESNIKDGNQTNSNRLGDFEEDVDTILANIISGILIVRLFTINDGTITLIVAPPGLAIDLEHTYVFKQPNSTLDSTYQYIQLMRQNRPSNFLSVYSLPFGYNDVIVNMVGLYETGESILYIALMGKTNFTYVQEDHSYLPTKTALGDDALLPVVGKNHSTLLSTSRRLTFWYYAYTYPIIMPLCFTRSPPTEAPTIFWPIYGGQFICSSDDGGLYITYDPCTKPVWLMTGFVDDQYIVLFDKDNNVAVYPKSAYNHPPKSAVDSVYNTDASDFWTKYEPPTTTPLPPPTTGCSTTVQKTTSRPSTPPSSFPKIYIPFTIGLLLLLLVLFLIIYRLCTRNDNSAQASNSGQQQLSGSPSSLKGRNLIQRKSSFPKYKRKSSGTVATKRWSLKKRRRSLSGKVKRSRTLKKTRSLKQILSG